MTEINWLIKRARRYLERNEPIPLDLFYQMLSAGVDVSEVERKYRSDV